VVGRAIDAYTSWCSKWQLNINSQKTQALIFLPPRCRSRIQRNPLLLNIHVNGTLIQPSSQVTYLGVIYDSKLTWKPQLQKIKTQATNRLNLIRRLVGTTWGLHTDTVITTYKVFLRPALTHGHLSWISASENLYNRLAISERHALRLAYRIKLPAPTADLYRRITFPTITQHLESLRTKYITKAIAEGNPLFLDAFQQDIIHDTPPRYQYTPLQHLLTLYHNTLDDNDPQKADFAIYRPFHLSPHIYPSEL